MTSDEAKQIKATCDVASDTIFVLTGQVKEARAARREDNERSGQRDAQQLKHIATLEELNARAKRRQVVTGTVSLVGGLLLGGFIVYKINQGDAK